jgi:topoisomerase IV subunit A
MTGRRKYHYLKSFTFDHVEKLTSFIGDHENSKLASLTEVEYPRLEVSFGGKNKDRVSEIIEVADFIGVKSYKARGKRLTNMRFHLFLNLSHL